MPHKTTLLLTPLLLAALGTAYPTPSQSQLAEEKPATGRSLITFVSTRHAPAGTLHEASQIYIMAADGTGVQRLTQNSHSDHFPALSPDGSRIVFDSNRLRTPGEPINTSDLFLMNSDGSRQTVLTRGSSASWSPDGSQIAFQASASGKGRPVKPYPGGAVSDGEIFVLRVGGLQAEGVPRNLTNSPAAIDEDADWSPSGDLILFTSHRVEDDGVDSETAEIFVTRADGKGAPVRLTNNNEEERAPSWSPDGRRIVYMCRGDGRDFEVCVMNSAGTQQRQLTRNAIADLTPSWSPDGAKIIFHRPVAPGAGGFQLWTINADGGGEARLTNTAGQNGFANWLAIPSEVSR